MLTPEQDAALDARDPDVRLCPHHIQILEFGVGSRSMMYLLRFKGHMIMEGDMPDEDGHVHVEDHRLFVMELPMVPEVWKNLRDAIREADETIAQITADHKRHPQRNMVDPESLAAFMNAIPDMFLRIDPRKDDGK
jgi:hypothetical protein